MIRANKRSLLFSHNHGDGGRTNLSLWRSDDSGASWLLLGHVDAEPSRRPLRAASGSICTPTQRTERSICERNCYHCNGSHPELLNTLLEWDDVTDPRASQAFKDQVADITQLKDNLA